MNRRRGNPGSIGALSKTVAGFARLTTRNYGRVWREAHATAGEAPALPGRLS
jgi:hypothetical protein